MLRPGRLPTRQSPPAVALKQDRGKQEIHRDGRLAVHPDHRAHPAIADGRRSVEAVGHVDRHQRIIDDPTGANRFDEVPLGLDQRIRVDIDEVIVQKLF